MNRLPFWILLLSIWLMVLVVLEHAFVPTAIQVDVLLFLVMTIVLGLFFSDEHAPTYLVVLITLLVGFVGVKLFQHGLFNQLQTYHITAAQSAAITLTSLITRQIGMRLREYEDVISGVTFSSAVPLPTSFADAQAVMYRELQRARYHERPLSIVLLQVDESAMEAAIPRISQEVQQTMIKKYILSKVARILDEDLPNFDPVALRDNCFIAVLPEATATDALEMAQHLRSTIEEKIGVKVQSGTATLVSEAMTFEELIECAEAKLQRATVPQSKPLQPELEIERTSLLSET